MRSDDVNETIINKFKVLQQLQEENIASNKELFKQQKEKFEWEQEQAYKEEREKVNQKKEPKPMTENAFKKALGNSIDKLKNSVGNMIGKIKSTISQPFSLLKTLGKVLAAGYLAKKLLPLFEKRLGVFWNNNLKEYWDKGLYRTFTEDIKPWFDNTFLPWLKEDGLKFMKENWKLMLGGAAIVSFLKNPLKFMLSPFKLAVSTSGFVTKHLLKMGLGIFKEVANLALGGAGFITKKISDTGLWVVKKTGQLGVNFAKNLGSFASKRFVDTKNIIDSGLGSMRTSLGKRLVTLKTNLMRGIGDVSSKVSTALGTLTDNLGGVNKKNKPSKMGKNIKAIKGLKGAIKYLTPIARMIPGLNIAVIAIELIDSFFPNLFSSIYDFFTLNSPETIMKKVSDKVSLYWEDTKLIGKYLTDKLKDKFNLVLEGIETWIRDKSSFFGDLIFDKKMGKETQEYLEKSRREAIKKEEDIEKKKAYDKTPQGKIDIIQKSIDTMKSNKANIIEKTQAGSITPEMSSQIIKSLDKSIETQIDKLGTFQVGGYTGAGKDNQIAGIVHKNEHVVPSKSVNKDGTISPLYPGVKTYDIPQVYHGKQQPNRVVTHRTAGHGFHTPTDSRALTKGLAAHFTVDRSGKVYQIGTPEIKMWHAGPKGNSNSIGIEATGIYKGGSWEKLTDPQERSLITLFGKIKSHYPINDVQPHYKLAPKSGTEGQDVLDLIKGVRGSFNITQSPTANSNLGKITSSSNKCNSTDSTDSNIINSASASNNVLNNRDSGASLSSPFRTNFDWSNMGSAIEKMANIGLSDVQGMMKGLGLKGFQEGGFTGKGKDDEVAGVVHKNEYVIPSKDLKKKDNNTVTSKSSVSSTPTEKYYKTLADVESKNKYFNADGSPLINKFGFAGKYQFGKSTVKPYLKKLGITWNEFLTTPEMQEKAIRMFTKDNDKILRKNGFETSDINRWYMHNMGSGGGIQIIKGKLSPKVLKNMRNQKGMNKNSTVQDYRNYYSKIFGGGSSDLSQPDTTDYTALNNSSGGSTSSNSLFSSSGGNYDWGNLGNELGGVADGTLKDLQNMARGLGIDKYLGGSSSGGIGSSISSLMEKTKTAGLDLTKGTKQMLDITTPKPKPVEKPAESKPNVSIASSPAALPSINLDSANFDEGMLAYLGVIG